MIIAVSVPFLQPGDVSLTFAIFMFVPTIFGILFASLWLLASDIFENTTKPEAARPLGTIGASSIAGGMSDGFAAKGPAPFCGGHLAVNIGALLLFSIVALVQAMHWRFLTNIITKKIIEGKRPTISLPYQTATHEPYFLLLWRVRWRAC